MKAHMTTGSTTEEDMYDPGDESNETESDDQFEVEVQPSSHCSRESSSGTNPSNVEGVQNIGGGDTKDKKLIACFECHIARSIWDMKKERGPLRCISHSRKLRAWKLEAEPPQIKDIVQGLGLMNLIEHSCGWIDMTLISAFVERWQPETNTFHMPFGEMTITLDDVARLLRIPVMCSLLSYEGGGRDIHIDELLQLVDEQLGMKEEVAKEETMGTYVVWMDWLKEQSQGKATKNSDAEVLDKVTHAYLLYTIGCCLFLDKSEMKISAYYVNALKRSLDEVRDKAWGVAILAYLYRQLGLASRTYVRQLSGCLTLLMAWIYDHFPMISNATLNPSYDDAQPRVCKWKNTQFGGDQSFALLRLREQLDTFTEHDTR